MATKDFLIELLKQAPALVTGIGAARSGPAAMSGFNQGRIQAQQEQYSRAQEAAALQRQAQLDAENTRRWEAQHTLSQSAEERARAADRRARQQQQVQNLELLMEAADRYGAPPEALFSALSGTGFTQEQAFAVTDPIVNTRDRKLARQKILDYKNNPRHRGLLKDEASLEALRKSEIELEWRPGTKATLGQLEELSGEPLVVVEDLPNTDQERQVADALAEATTQAGRPLTPAERVAVREQTIRRWAAAGRDPLLGQLRQSQLDAIAAQEDAGRRIEQVPSVARNVIERSSLSVPEYRRGRQVNTLLRLYEEGDIDGFKSTAMQTAIESEFAGVQQQINGRRVALKALDDIEALVRKVPTNLVRGTVEDTARALGLTTDPEMVRMQNRINEVLFEYRRAMTGVQFSLAESEQYRTMFPNYDNTLPVNLAQIQALKNAMRLRQRDYFEFKLSEPGARWVVPELYNGVSDQPASETPGSSPAPQTPPYTGRYSRPPQ